MDEAAFKLLIAGVYVIIGVSLLMIAFSEERQEDEFIRSLRGRSLAAAACVAFVLSVIWFCVSSINLMYFPMHEAMVRNGGHSTWWTIICQSFLCSSSTSLSSR